MDWTMFRSSKCDRTRTHYVKQLREVSLILKMSRGINSVDMQLYEQPNGYMYASYNQSGTMYIHVLSGIMLYYERGEYIMRHYKYVYIIFH